MTILDILSKRLHHINQSSIIVIDNINLLAQNIQPTAEMINEHITHKIKHIYLKNTSNDPGIMANLIMDVFRNIKLSNVGTTIYIDDQPDGFVDYIKEKFSSEEYKNDRVETYKGLSIQHIIGVGYIISIIDVCTDIIVREYEADDYMSRLDDYVIVGMAKQEKHYVKDWVAYHLRIGFDKIYLFDNNTGDERYDELLSEYMKSGQLEIMDVRDRTGIQNHIYNSAYYALPYKWMAVIDIDEYIWFRESGKYSNIKQFISSIEPRMDASFFGILLQWHCYASSGEDHPSDKPIYIANSIQLPRYARKDSRCEYIHDWCKSIYRPGYDITLNEHFAWDHVVNDGVNEENICRQVDYNGVVTQKPFLVNISEEDFNNEDVFVKHFLLRNIDDFFRNKYLRGHAGADFGTGQDGWRFYQWFQNINYFTDISGTITKDEQLYLLKHGMKMNYTFHPDVFLYVYTIDNNSYINDIIDQNVVTESILPQTNTFLHKLHITGDFSVIQPRDEDMKIHKYADIEFMSKEISIFQDGNFHIGNTHTYIKPNIQEPVIITIGIPMKYMAQEISTDEQKHFVEFMKAIFNPDSVRNMLRTALDYNTTVIPTLGIDYNNDTYDGFKEPLAEFMSSMGLTLPQYKMTCNTMVMSYQQFRKVVKFNEEFYKKFGHISNTQICEDLKNGTPNIYNAYENSILSVIEHPYYVWPS